MLNWISGSKTIKKNNISDHLKANHHQSVVQILKERAAEKSESSQITEAQKLASTIAVPSSSETSILTHFQQLNLWQTEQLLKKFQLAHFIIQNDLAFMKYEFTHFKKEFRKVNFGVGFLNDKSCCEIIIFLSNSTITQNVVKPLNEKKTGTILVYYVMALCQQQQTMKKNSILSKHAKKGTHGLMFFHYNNQTILVPQDCIWVLKILSEVPVFLVNEENLGRSWTWWNKWLHIIILSMQYFQCKYCPSEIDQIKTALLSICSDSRRHHLIY